MEKIKYRNNNIETINLDVKGKKVERILENYDLAINCLPGFIGFKILKRIIKCRVSCVDISFMPQNCMELSELGYRLPSLLRNLEVAVEKIAEGKLTIANENESLKKSRNKNARQIQIIGIGLILILVLFANYVMS